ncbi:MAG: lysylphosphatidylglycerol synthase domain-containing protein, partial [Candidatus Peribacteraceae bacterium]
MQRTALYALKGIGIVLFAWILLHIDIHSALQNFAQASPIFIGLTFVLFPIIYLIKSWRWHVLIRQKNIAVCFQESVHIYVASLFLGI